MKPFLIAATLLFSVMYQLNAQDRYVIAESNVHFYSYAALENIEADNSDAKAVVDASSNAFSFRIPIKSFIFDKELMQEHFNENYMESEKYPNGTFKGTIEGSYSFAEDGEYDVNAVGVLDIHGVAQKRNIPSTITVENGVATITSKFMVKLVDHNIAIPKVVFYNIAEEIEVKTSFVLKPLEKK